MSLRVLRLSLENAGFEVVTAGDGAEAMKILGDRSCDVLVTDLNMPRMNGHELCEAVQTECAGRVPIIFVLTARPGEDHRTRAKRLENVEFLEKPASLRHLIMRIRERLGAASESGAKSP
jgi:DNA-binding response OmpR family regulator